MRTLPFVFSGETVRLCMEESENPNLRLRSCLELWSRSWHGWFLEQSFLVQNLFYNDTFVDVLFWGLDGNRKLSRCLPNTSTFVPNDRSQYLYCVLPIMRCAFGAHLDVGLAERPTPCRFVGNLTFPSLFLGKMAVFDRQNRYFPCEVVSCSLCQHAMNIKSFQSLCMFSVLLLIAKINQAIATPRWWTHLENNVLRRKVRRRRKIRVGTL